MAKASPVLTCYGTINTRNPSMPVKCWTLRRPLLKYCTCKLSPIVSFGLGVTLPCCKLSFYFCFSPCNGKRGDINSAQTHTHTHAQTPAHTQTRDIQVVTGRSRGRQKHISLPEELSVGCVCVAAAELGIVAHISAGWLDELAGGVRGETRCHPPGVRRGDCCKNKTITSSPHSACRSLNSSAPALTFHLVPTLEARWE